MQEIRKRGGFRALKKFFRSVESPYEAGNACGADDQLASDNEFLPSLLDSTIDADSQFASAYIWRRFDIKSWEWIDGIDRFNWSVKAKARFFSVLPSVKEVWQRAESELGTDKTEYWKQTRVRPDRDHLEDFDHAIKQLIANGRPDTAIECFWLGELWTEPYPELALQSLEAFKSDHSQVDAYAIQEIFNHLQKLKDVDEERLAAMEIKFLDLLDRHGEARPRTLYSHLAERPEFFCEIIRMIYRSQYDALENKEKKKPEVDEQTAAIAEGAYRLLMDWNYPPGSIRNGSFDDEKLNSWISYVKENCEKSGHWEAASHQIGEVLYYAPKDKDGLWLESICELFDSKEDSKYRRGLEIRIFNSRGAYWSSGGKEEINLAKKWENIARLAEKKGFSRLGSTLRELSESYRKDAKRSVLESRYDFG